MDSINAEIASKFGGWAPRPAGDVYARARRLFDFVFKVFVFDSKIPEFDFDFDFDFDWDSRGKAVRKRPAEKSGAGWAPQTKFELLRNFKCEKFGCIRG